MYKLGTIIYNQTKPSCVIRTTDGACIPFDPANSDYAQFLKDIKEGVELLDADGQVMDAIQFVNTLP